VLVHLRVQLTRTDIHRVYLGGKKKILSFILYAVHYVFLTVQGTLNVNKPQTLFFIVLSSRCIGAYSLKIALDMHEGKIFI